MTSTKTLTKPFYSMVAATEYAGLGTHALNGAVRRKELKTFFIGRKQFVTKEELTKYLERRNERT